MVNNPIISVNGLTVKTPTTFSWKLEDISSSSAGRTENTVMDKAQIGQTVGLELGWNNLTTDELNQILKAFNNQYSTITYVDPLFGDANDDFRRTSIFYTGNRNTTMYNQVLGLWSVATFNVIEKDARK